MSNLGEKASRFLAAGKELVGGVVEAASEKLDEIMPEAPAVAAGSPVTRPIPVATQLGEPGWRSINIAPQAIKDLARMSGGGEFRAMLDLNSNPTRLYALWATNGIVEAYYEIPRLR